MLNFAEVERILSQIPSRVIGVLGDLFLDRYLDIDANLTESSIETSLDAYQVIRVRSQPGAAGTVINNLFELGVGRIIPIATIGDDGEGHELRQALSQMPSVDHTHTHIRSDIRTPTYIKPMLLKNGISACELNRLDIKNRTRTPCHADEQILRSLDAIWNQLDALLVLDQVTETDCGVVTSAVRDRLAELAGNQPDRFVLVDSRSRIGAFRNVNIKPNLSELGGLPKIRGPELAAYSGRTVFCTRSEEGIVLYRNDSEPILVPGFPVVGPIDAVGAGDSCSAGIACAAAIGCDHVSAAQFGNLVASITVQQIGTTGTANPMQVRNRWREVGSANNE